MMKYVIMISCSIFLLNACAPKNQGMANMPACLATKIDSMKKDVKANPPTSVIQYNYKGAPVYYVTAGCCDQFNEVYDENCKQLGAPDGGITGKGDGKLPDFYSVAINKKVVWEDK
jgi:hypothetical protein